MLIVGSLSCLTVVTSAATVLQFGYTPDTANAEDPSERVLAWEFFDDGTLCLYDYPGAVSWTHFAKDLLKVELKPGPGATECMLAEIPAYAFYDCYNLAEVDVSKGVYLEIIGAYAFNGCTALENIKLDQGIVTLSDYAFYGCTALETITLSYNLANVGVNIFKGCTRLKTVNIPNGVKSIGYGMFEGCSALEAAVLPDSVVEIGELAFFNCAKLNTIVVPDSTEKVGDQAFAGCSSATTAYIGHNADEIGAYAFSGCSSLAAVEIASTMKTFSEGMFMNCSALSSIEIAEGVQEIRKNAFKGCSALSAITLPTSLRVIGDSAFDSTALQVIAIPADVTEVQNGAFTNCASLTAINVDGKNDVYYSKDGILYDIGLTTLIACPAGKSGEIEVPGAVEVIADDAFIGCVNITKVTIPDSVTTIGANAFNNCSDDLVIKTSCDSSVVDYAKTRGIEVEPIHVGSKTWKETVSATCLATGTKELVCSACDFVYETATIDALGHDYDDGVVTKKATCDEAGVMTFTCTRNGCSDSYTEAIPALKHKFDTGEVLVAPKCDVDGTMRYSCQNAGCLEYYDEVIPMLNHNMDNGTITKAATCTDDGEKVYKCQNAGCLHRDVEVIPATDHNYDKGVVTTEATCTEDGVKTFTCQNAGCKDFYTEVIAATGHEYVAVKIKDATCLENGKIQHTCSKCGDSYIESTVGEHVMYSQPVRIEPTCTADGKEGNKCAVCGQFIGAVTTLTATGHNYVDGTCTGCGDTNSQQQPNQGGTVVTPEDNNQGGSNNNGNNQNTSAKPATPKLLLLRNRNEGLVLTWEAVSGANGYRVYRRGAGDKSWTYLTTVKGTSYVDAKAQTGKYYRYTVRATNAAGYSGFENGLYIKRVATPHVTGVTNGAKGVVVTWSAISNAKTYKVYRRGAGGSWACIATVTGTSFVDTKALSGNYYRYTVRAIDGYYSYFEDGLLTKYVAAPKMKSVANSSNGVKVTWNSVSGADSYRVYRRGAGQSWVYVTTVKGTSFVDTTIGDSTGYYRYTVRAVDGGRYSGFEDGLLIKR